MQNSRFLKIGLIVLLLINVSTLAYLWIDGHQRPRQQGPDVFNFLCHELKLTPDQVQQYESLRQQHHAAVQRIQEHGHQLRERFFGMLELTPIDSGAVKSLADSIAAMQEQIEKVTFYHFSQLRTILTPDQKKRFDEVIQEALSMMAPKPPGPPPSGPRE